MPIVPIILLTLLIRMEEIRYMCLMHLKDPLIEGFQGKHIQLKHMWKLME